MHRSVAPTRRLLEARPPDVLIGIALPIVVAPLSTKGRPCAKRAEAQYFGLIDISEGSRIMDFCDIDSRRRYVRGLVGRPRRVTAALTLSSAGARYAGQTRRTDAGREATRDTFRDDDHGGCVNQQWVRTWRA